MRVSYLLFFITLAAFGQSKPSIQVLSTPDSLEDFEHQYKGCLENSECDQVMGLQLTRWKDLITKVNNEKVDAKKKAQYLELFRAKYGIPTEFYTFQKSQQGFKPMLFNSSCKDHNPKAPDQKILIGTSFIKSISKDKAIVWRDQAQIEVPTETLIIPQPVIVYYPEGEKTYNLPLEDQPLMIKNKELVVIKEEEGLFYALNISESGDWKIEYLDMSRITEWEDKKQEVACPKDKAKPAPKVFGVEFCKNVWDEDSKKTVVVKLRRGCVL